MMKDYGLVSIITPNYNCANFIAQTIESVLAQTYSNWELLIQDDASKDASVDIAKEYARKDSRIKVQINEKNLGAALTRNNALNRAAGDWIAFLDSDDLWSVDKLQKQLNFMISNNYYFTYTKYCKISEDNQLLGKTISGPQKISKSQMYNYCWPGCLTVMYNTEKIGLIQIADIKKNNDYAMWLRVCRKADCYLLDEVLAKYRIHSGSISNNSYLKLIKWHWILFHDAEGQGVVKSTLNTIRNLFFGVAKKVLFVK